MPLISIIVPVYNVEKYLDRCIKSILRQSFKDFELIIVDDGSPDACPEMCDEWEKKDNRIKVIHQKNQGLSAARNAGIRIAQGRYLSFIDSDDWISDTMIQDLYDLLIESDADISVCGMIKVADENTKIRAGVPDVRVYSRDEFMKIILRIKGNRCIHYACGKLYKKEVLDPVAHYPVGMLNEDVEGMFKALVRADRVAETTKVGYFYFENNESISRTKFGKNFLCLDEVWKRVLELSREIAPEYAEYVEYNYKRTDFTILTDCLLYGDKQTDELYDANIKEIRRRLKKNIWTLLKGPMQSKRKVLMLIVCYFFGPVRFVLRHVHAG
ncbi:MAG: glycosyltransferase family 2 protein [Porcipelethomonas sp.]